MPNKSKKEPPLNPDDHGSEPAKGQFLVYQAEDGKLKLDVRFEDESVWLTQQLMADLFQTTKQNISLHIQNIYEEGELVPKSTVKKYLTVRQEGNRQVKRQLDHYNLDMIISVGYRVQSHVATRFRQWATRHIREFIVKGFVLDDERLKQGKNFGRDYFEELLERIKSRYDEQVSPYYAASRLWTDAIIDPRETRTWISMGIEMAEKAPAEKPYNVGVIQS